MGRRIWMDRTIEAARATDIVLPWTRRAPRPAEPTATKPAANG